MGILARIFHRLTIKGNSKSRMKLKLELNQQGKPGPLYHITIEAVEQPTGRWHATAYRTDVKSGERVKLSQRLSDGDEGQLRWYIEDIRRLWPDAVGVGVGRKQVSFAGNRHGKSS